MTWVGLVFSMSFIAVHLSLKLYLDPKGDFKGKPIVSELLTISENQRDSISIILAGYADDMQEKLYSYNDGLKSRFEEVYFEDFDEAELNLIWNHLLESKGWTADPKVGYIVCKRLSIMANKKGFGNARAVRIAFESAIKKAFTRKDWSGAMYLQLSDIMGERPTDNPKLKREVEVLEKRIGWTSIKSAVKQIVELAEKNFDREINGQPPLPFSMNRLFLGNPGVCISITSDFIMQRPVIYSFLFILYFLFIFIIYFFGFQDGKNHGRCYLWADSQASQLPIER
jgi:hypothetical protein